MFVNSVVSFFLSAVLASAGGSAARSAPDVSGSCAELARAREETEAATARLADWMDHHCPGSLEVTEPFCRLQSSALLERLSALGDLNATFAAKRCELHEVRDTVPTSPKVSTGTDQAQPAPLRRRIESRGARREPRGSARGRALRSTRARNRHRRSDGYAEGAREAGMYAAIGRCAVQRSALRPPGLSAAPL
jgi:hypothetical protein